MLKKLLVHTRKSMKIFILIAFSVAIIATIVIVFFQPTYIVKINGEQVGYTQNKRALQERINEYSEKGEGDNVAFVQIPSMPEYEVCMIKRDINTNDDEIFELIKQEGIKYYRYYAILEDQEEKYYVSTFQDAEAIIQELKDKDSTNIDKISIVEKYETELKEFSDKDTAVAALYKERPKVVVAVKKTYTTYAATGSVNTATTTADGAPNIGISLIRPVYGIVSSRFAERSSLRRSYHTGLDLATSSGTPIAAAASGTVTFSGWQGSYGNLLVISHGNGVQTYYGHCSALYVSAGAQVGQGDTIAAVGSTGNSTGPHLHFEVRVDGVAYNPEYYV